MSVLYSRLSLEHVFTEGVQKLKNYIQIRNKITLTVVFDFFTSIVLFPPSKKQFCHKTSSTQTHRFDKSLLFESPGSFSSSKGVCDLILCVATSNWGVSLKKCRNYFCFYLGGERVR